MAPLLPIVALPAVLLAAETMPRPPDAESRFNGMKRLAVWLTIASQFALIGWGAVTAATADAFGIASLAISIGLGAGVFGMLAAHEMIHSRNRLENAIGLLMLAAMTYRHFRISHLFGHHRWAATPRDPATARRGESAYAFLGRSTVCQWTDALRFERRRLRRTPWEFWRNRLFHDLAIYAILYGALYAAFGWRAVAFQALQSIVAISVLELFNYVAHYGLERTAERGPLSDRHSWNAGGGIGNWLLLNMGHHSDHHRAPARPYGRLAPIEPVPALPGGYVGAILVALVPPLWRRRMDPRVERWMDEPATQGQT